jgi:hypothetical protein
MPLAVLMKLGPPVEAVVVDDGTHPSSKRVTIRCECRGCDRVLARYTGGLRLTMAHPRFRGGEVVLRDGFFVFDCQNPRRRVLPSGGLSAPGGQLRAARDQGRRRFVIT